MLCAVVVPAAACLLILCSLGAIVISQWAEWSPDYKMWYHSVSVPTGRYQHQSYWNDRLFSSNAEVSGYLEYQLHIKGTELNFWSSLRYIKIWIVFCYRGIKFPPQSSGSVCAREWWCMYQFKWPLCKEKYGVNFGMRLQAKCDKEQDLCRYWLPEHYIKQLYDKPTGDGYLSKKCGLGEEWRSDIAVSRTLSKCPYVQYANTRCRNISDQHYCPQSTLT